MVAYRLTYMPITYSATTRTRATRLALRTRTRPAVAAVPGGRTGDSARTLTGPPRRSQRPARLPWCDPWPPAPDGAAAGGSSAAPHAGTPGRRCRSDGAVPVPIADDE